MAKAKIKTVMKSPAKMQYAGFWQRFAAFFIDFIVFILLAFLVSHVCFLLFVIYETYFIGKYGATFGKKWLGIKVVNKDGKVIGYEYAFLRLIGRIVVFPFTLCIGYLIIPFTENKQGLHDKIAKTYVIKAETEF